MEDRYPSRCGGETTLARREDPVVYGPPSNAAPLSAAEVERYERDGFLHMDSFLAEDELAGQFAEMQRLVCDASLVNRDEVITELGSDAVRSIFDVHVFSDVFARLANDRRLLDIAEFLLGDDARFHQTRLNFKPGFEGQPFFWHSDFETWHVEDGMPGMRALSMTLALTDNTEFNGPVMMVPGSHEVFIGCPGETPENHYKSSLKKQEIGVPDKETLSNVVSKRGIASTRGRAGSLTIFDCNLLHGSNSNISPFPRSNLFLVFNAASNRLVQPFGGTRPRPNYIAHRDVYDDRLSA
jgi:ectoine hydroxylase